MLNGFSTQARYDTQSTGCKYVEMRVNPLVVIGLKHLKFPFLNPKKGKTIKRHQKNNLLLFPILLGLK